MLCLAWGCGTQELPLTRQDEADFELRGSLAGSDLALTAGQDGYFMGTDYAEVSPALWQYQGHLAPSGCVDCPQGLSLSIRDYRQHAPQVATNLDSALAPGNYAFYQTYQLPGQDVVRVAFENDEANSNGYVYRWDFGDGGSAQGGNPTHDYAELGAYTVCLDGMDSTGCRTTICNEIFLGDSLCQLDFEHRLFPNSRYVEFRARMEGTPPFAYRWDFGDGYGSSLANPGYTYAQPGRYRVCVSVTDAEGCQQSLCKNIAADPALCTHNFSYGLTRTQVGDSVQRSRVTLVWTDAAGKRYSSAQGPQPGTSYFTLLSQAPYGINERGVSVRRIEARFHVRLFADDETYLDLVADAARLGLAHP
jgi:chitodextrinase